MSQLVATFEVTETVQIGCAETFTVTLSDAEPPGPSQVMVYVLEDVRLPVDCEPLVAFDPLQAPEAVQDVVFEELQERLAEVLYEMEMGPSCPFALISTDGAVGGAGAVTVSVKVVVLVTPPPVAVTVTVELPGGVEFDVFIVSVLAHVGLHAPPPEKEPVVPCGSPETENETDCVLPEVSVAVIPFVTEFPRTTVRLPPFEREKLKEGVGAGRSIVKVLRASPELPRSSVTLNRREYVPFGREEISKVRGALLYMDWIPGQVQSLPAAPGMILIGIVCPTKVEEPMVISTAFGGPVVIPTASHHLS